MITMLFLCVSLLSDLKQNLIKGFWHDKYECPFCLEIAPNKPYFDTQYTCTCEKLSSVFNS